LLQEEIQLNRSPLFKIAVVLFALLSLFSVVASIPALLGGPDQQGIAAGIPQAIIILGALTGVAGLLAAYGVWRGQKWGVWLAIILSAVNALSALPGVLFAPSAFARILAIVGVVVSIFIIVVLLRQPKPSLSEG
jgi:hypothetical protein